MIHKRAGTSFFLAVVIAALATPLAARAADPPRGKGAENPSKAAAALFYEARALIGTGEYAAACEKFEKSLALDRGLGTEFNLADCNERVGKVATAWAGFQSVSASARGHDQLDRARVALARAKALEPQLPRLVVEARATDAGLEIRRDGVLVETSQRGTAVPVDPGVHTIVATAAGKPPWKTTVDAVRGVTARVTVPQDLAAPPAIVVAPAASDASASLAATTQTTSAPVSLAEPAADRAPTQRTFGYVVGGVGIACLGAAAFFGLDSMSKRDRAKDHCGGALCDAEGVELRDDAIRSGNAATIASIAAGLAGVGSAVLILTSSGKTARPAASGALGGRKGTSSSLEIVPHVALGGGGITLQGALQ